MAEWLKRKRREIRSAGKPLTGSLGAGRQDGQKRADGTQVRHAKPRRQPPSRASDMHFSRVTAVALLQEPKAKGQLFCRLTTYRLLWPRSRIDQQCCRFHVRQLTPQSIHVFLILKIASAPRGCVSARLYEPLPSSLHATGIVAPASDMSDCVTAQPPEHQFCGLESGPKLAPHPQGPHC